MQKMIQSIRKKNETRNTKVKMLIPKGRPQRNKRMLMLFIQGESIRVCTAVMTVVHMCTNMRKGRAGLVAQSARETTIRCTPIWPAEKPKLVPPL